MYCSTFPVGLLPDLNVLVDGRGWLFVADRFGFAPSAAGSERFAGAELAGALGLSIRLGLRAATFTEPALNGFFSTAF